MTRKDFVAIAQAAKYGITDDAQRSRFITLLLPTLEAANPQFNAVRFCIAANVPVKL